MELIAYRTDDDAQSMLKLNYETDTHILTVTTGQEETLSINLQQLTCDCRYEVLIVRCSETAQKMYRNFDDQFKIVAAPPIFYEQYYYKQMINAEPARVRLVRTAGDKVFIIIRSAIVEANIPITSEDVQMEQLLKEHAVPEEEIQEYLTDFDNLTKYMEFLSRMPVRSSVAYLDLQSDLILKMMRILMKHADEETKNEIKSSIPEIEALLESLDADNILTYKSEQQVSNTLARKAAVRTAQKAYYEQNA